MLRLNSGWGEFKRGRTTSEDEARPGPPLDVTEMCKKARHPVYSDRRIQVEEIAQALGISHGRDSTNVHDRLGMRKLTARWVPKFFNDEQIATRASVCSADETWIHYKEPGNKDCKRRYYVGLFTQEKYNIWSVLCKLARPTENRHP